MIIVYTLDVLCSVCLEGLVGIEPTTRGLKGPCSATELQAPDGALGQNFGENETDHLPASKARVLDRRR